MAARKPLFMGTAGWSEEMAVSDVMTLGGLTMGGDIDMASAGVVKGLLAADLDGEALVYGQDAANLQALVLDKAGDALDLAGTGNIIGLQISTAGAASGDALCHSQASAALLGAGLTLGGNLAMAANKITGIANASASADVPSWAQVQAIATGFTYKEPVRCATTAALPAYTASGSKVGKTLTANAVGLLIVDGQEVLLGERVLVWVEGGGEGDVDHGIYECTTQGTVGVAYVLTRATDCDEDAEVKPGMFVPVNEGLLYGDTFFLLTSDGPITVDTTPLTFVEFAPLSDLVAGDGLTSTGKTLNVGAGDGIAVAADSVGLNLVNNAGLQVGPGGLAVYSPELAGTGLEQGATAYLLRLAAQGNGISGGGGSLLSVNVDSETGGNIQGVNVTANGVGLDISAIAGTGLEADGAANLRIAAAAAGDGLQGGAGSALAVDVSDFAGTGLEDDGLENLRIAAAAAGDGLTGGAGSALAIDLAASPCLEFNAGQLQVKFDGTVNDFFARSANGLAILGLPALFTVNDVAVGATVTAPNFDTLTDGSNADSLHVHASAEATEAPKIENNLTSAEAFAIGDPVYFTSGGKAGKCLATDDAKAYVVGVAREAATGVDEIKGIVSHGICTGALTGATPGAPQYLDSAGGITAVFGDIGAGERAIRVGFAKTASDLWVEITDLGKKAA